MTAHADFIDAPVHPEGVTEAVAQGRYHAPHDVLGCHPHGGGYAIVASVPNAVEMEVLTPSDKHPMVRGGDGLWRATVPGRVDGSAPTYRLGVTDPGRMRTVMDDPYRHLPSVSDADLAAFSSGQHRALWRVLGAVPYSLGDDMGTGQAVGFAVWAPNAHAVRVMGDFNDWNGEAHAMRTLGGSGVWELMVPGVEVGQRYKYQILTDHGWVDHADPMAQWSEQAPATASRVFASEFEWTDQEWLAQRERFSPHAAPMSVYEVHLPSWRPGLSYRELATELVQYVTDQGFTHVEFMPVAQHPFGGSWGYQVTGYYASLADLGSPDDLRYLVNALHEAGIGVLVDWVPAHFPKDPWALAMFDGHHTYEYGDSRRGEHPDWGTLVFNYGRTEVRNFLVANALFWLKEFHVDGLRVDAVASMLYLDYSRPDGQWTPNHMGGREHLEAIDFLREVNTVCYEQVPGVVMIAEESTAWQGVTAPVHHGGLGFGLKWNMGWMHDTLRYLSTEPFHRQYHHHDITFSMVYAWSENYMLPISHDEVVHGKGTVATRVPGDHWQQMATVRAYYAFMWAHPGKKLLFMGQEFGQKTEWSHDRGTDWACLEDPLHAKVLQLIGNLNGLYREHGALWEQDDNPNGFEWLESGDASNNVIAFARYDTQHRPVVCVVNFSAVPHHDYMLRMPRPGMWREVLNTDAHDYGGSGVGNDGAVLAQPHPDRVGGGQATLTLPPLATLYFTPQ